MNRPGHPDDALPVPPARFHRDGESGLSPADRPPRPASLGWLAARLPALLLGFSLGVLAAGLKPQAGPASRDEYEVKAAFLHKFPLFVEWPAGAVGATNDPIKVCVLGRDPFGPRLENVISNRLSNGRPFEFHRVRQVEEAVKAGCQILFIADSERPRLPAILAGVAGRPILTVSDSPGFGPQGVMINFFLQDGSVKFELNRPAAKAAGLRLSSQLPHSPPPATPKGGSESPPRLFLRSPGVPPRLPDQSGPRPPSKPAALTLRPAGDRHGPRTS